MYVPHIERWYVHVHVCCSYCFCCCSFLFLLCTRLSICFCFCRAGYLLKEITVHVFNFTVKGDILVHTGTVKMYVFIIPWFKDSVYMYFLTDFLNSKKCLVLGRQRYSSNVYFLFFPMKERFLSRCNYM